MSKTVDLQIEKSSFLIEGVRKNINILKDKGFNPTELDQMSADLKALAEASKECDAAYEILAEKRKKMNDILDGVKAIFADKKRIIKTNFPQEQWMKLGVQDKR